MIDWEQLLSQHGIDYRTSGENVKRGEINVSCPWCSDDPSYHLGIDPERNYFSCWRDKSHSGKRPHRLLLRLIGMPYAETDRLLGKAGVPDGFDQFVRDLHSKHSDADHKRIDLEVPEEFSIIDRTPRASRFRSYLTGRGIRNPGAFGLMYWDSVRWSKWQDRIIIPFQENGKVVAWSARSITDHEFRYLTTSPERESGSIKTTDLLFNLERISDNVTTLVVVEGTFDAIKVHQYGKAFGLSAVAISTTSISDAQLSALVRWMKRRRDRVRISVALDRTAIAQSNDVAREISPFAEVGIYQYEGTFEDPSEMPRSNILRIPERSKYVG